MNPSAHDHHIALIHRYFEAYLQGDPNFLDAVALPEDHQVNGSTRQSLEETKQGVAHFAGSTFSMTMTRTSDDAIVCGKWLREHRAKAASAESGASTEAADA